MYLEFQALHGKKHYHLGQLLWHSVQNFLVLAQRNSSQKPPQRLIKKIFAVLPCAVESAFNTVVKHEQMFHSYRDFSKSQALQRSKTKIRPGKTYCSMWTMYRLSNESRRKLGYTDDARGISP